MRLFYRNKNIDDEFLSALDEDNLNFINNINGPDANLQAVKEGANERTTSTDVVGHLNGINARNGIIDRTSSTDVVRSLNGINASIPAVVSESLMAISSPPMFIKDCQGLVNLKNEFINRVQNSMNQQICINCFCNFYTVVFQNDDLCEKCKKKPNKFTILNDLKPSPLPNCFKELTLAEQGLISRSALCETLVPLKYGQYAMSGHSIFFLQNFESVAMELPPQCSEIITFGRMREDGRISCLRVPRQKVLNFLHYLKTHNPFYADVLISNQRLSALPASGCCSFTFSLIT